ncbi:excisionase family DNA-binding protein [Rhodohalobacter sp.]|uniref:excisionase family DNA-binding protein n=1 Tax=Rhodohalobacter sp. TaxID=1974210 RepID=UPI002ACF02CB|nr:excisionase family DNA-binding protein [Rhodohalobacter sp.]MDZ7755088.1 excisionase family DNA-binding protein [Rhodohalobacter sp.]
MEHRIDSSEFKDSEIEAILDLIRRKKPALVDPEGNRTELPEPLFKMLVHIVEQMKQGRAIIMMPEDETFTTQAAANFLGVSRQHLVNLLEDGEIPHHKVGSHRRVYFRDLKAYADKRDAVRRKTMDELFDEVTKAGKYSSESMGDER